MSGRICLNSWCPLSVCSDGPLGEGKLHVLRRPGRLGSPAREWQPILTLHSSVRLQMIEYFASGRVHCGVPVFGIALDWGFDVGYFVMQHKSVLYDF
eukprot:2449251-Amphidinium_carterae.1